MNEFMNERMKDELCMNTLFKTKLMMVRTTPTINNNNDNIDNYVCRRRIIY